MPKVKAKDRVSGPGWEGYVDDILTMVDEPTSVLVRGLVYQTGKNEPGDRAKYFAHKVRDWHETEFTLQELQAHLLDAIKFEDPEPAMLEIPPDTTPTKLPSWWDSPPPRYPPRMKPAWYEQRYQAMVILREAGWSFNKIGKVFRISGTYVSQAMEKYSKKAQETSDASQ